MLGPLFSPGRGKGLIDDQMLNVGPSTQALQLSATNSLLYQKLAGTQTCGQSMPFGASYSGDLALVFDWIQAGAQQ